MNPEPACLGDLANSRLLGDLVATRAAADPGRIFVHFEERALSFGVLEETSNRFGNRLLSMGLARGDKVGIMLDNCPEFLAAWTGIAKSGMVEVPINVGYKGDLLAYLLNQAEVRLLVIDGRWIERIAAIADELTSLQWLVTVGDGGSIPIEVFGFGEFLESGAPTPPQVAVHPYDPATILFTSGTTGRSKGAVRSHHANHSVAEVTIDLMRYQPGEVLFTVFPLFHINAKVNTIIPALLLDGTVVMHSRFHASTFWESCRQHGVTAFNYMGALLMMLYKQPARPDDDANPVRKAYGAPAPLEIFEAFQERFGVQLVEVYGSTECGIVTRNIIEEMNLGSCGQAVPFYEVEIHDEHDQPCPPGTPGEIVVRPRRPFVMFTEYYRAPEATAAAFRNLWFHTGDRGTVDQDGWFRYHDRIKDSIRRRGENISSWEVEKVINSIPEVAESAVIGVPTELTEEEVLALVIFKPGQSLTPEQILDHAQERLPHFAVPRYLRFVEEFPRTPSQRVEKYKLREEGLAAGTWDRVEHGYEVKR